MNFSLQSQSSMWLPSDLKIGTLPFAPQPIYTFLLKIISFCNLNCSYCYMYNSADQTWQQQPKRMVERVIRQTGVRIKEHAIEHGLTKVAINFHGGEPMLAGVDYLRKLTKILDETVAPIEISYGIQSNGTLLTEEWINFLLEKNISIGISIDGPMQINDQNRVYHDGSSSYSDLIKALTLLGGIKENVRYGFLCVIDPESNPIEVYDHLNSFNPKQIDFLLPLNNHNILPRGKHSLSSSDTSYGDWLITIFDRWYTHYTNSAVIRYFQDIISLIIGANNSVETIGLGKVDLVVVETNGDIEAVDSLKSTFEGATNLGLDVFSNKFDDALVHPAVYSRQLGKESLCQSCRNCSLVEVCGGGYIPHRYSRDADFLNPSIYCEDLKKLILHIHKTISLDISKL